MADLDALAALLQNMQKTQEDTAKLHNEAIDQLAQQVKKRAKSPDAKRKRDVPERAFLKHQFLFNEDCLRLLEKAIGSGDEEESSAALADLRSKLRVRNYHLQVDDKHPGFLDFADDFCAGQELKKDGVDNSVVEAFLKHRGEGGGSYLANAINKRRKTSENTSSGYQNQRQPFRRGGTEQHGGASAAVVLPPNFGFPTYNQPAAYGQPSIQNYGAQGVFAPPPNWSWGNAAIAQPPPAGQFYVGGARGGFQRQPIQCYTCRQWGHVQRDCPQGDASQSSSDVKPGGHQ